jgi:hypothetical protein
MIICHRVNTIEKLNTVPHRYGIEIDIRFDNRTGRLYLNHDPGTGEDFEEFLKHYTHAFIILNIKEAGIEQQCIELMKRFNITRNHYFLLDVEFPFIYRAAGFARKEQILSGELDRNHFVHEIAVRYSEAEPIEQALALKGLVDWVWIDTNTKLPLDHEAIERLKGFKTCLVCPERWGRPQDIAAYAEQMRKLGFKLDAVMTALQYIPQWENSGVLK